jgi:broad specificity phosphatase PhoE
MEERLVTTFYLVRHGAYALLGQVLLGRKLDVPLDARGREQAEGLGERFARIGIDFVQTSPRLRTVETAIPIARWLGLPLTTEPAVDELDCGEWSARSFDELNGDARWQAWNTSRSTTRTPNGESMADVQWRIVAHLERMRALDARGRGVIVSHCDVIRAAMLYYRFRSLDDYGLIDIPPAAVETLMVDHRGRAIVATDDAAA